MKSSALVVSVILACSVSACVVAPPPRAHARSVVDIDVSPPPPRVVVEPAPRRGYVWAPGYWQWDGRRHVWVEGRWIRERRGEHWVPAHWEDHGGRWHFEEGHWAR
jgi:WXXGXW repeat (2 copies)